VSPPKYMTAFFVKLQLYGSASLFSRGNMPERCSPSQCCRLQPGNIANGVFEQVYGREKFDSGDLAFGANGGCWTSGDIRCEGTR
jgi:hypothetical protein